MVKVLQENAGIPASLLYVLAAIAGISVANLYYNQPLLDMMRESLGCSEIEASHIALFTQVGYALGLLFIIPLGDLFSRKVIVTVNFTVLILSLLAIATASGINMVHAASLVTGVCSVIPQIFVPLAAQYSKPEHKGKNIGIIISGLLTGILASRVVSGYVGEVLGWREMYYIAAGLMLLSCVTVLKILPDTPANFNGSYRDLMSSIFVMVRRYPALRIYALRSAFAFGAFMSLWASLAFMMSGPPFYAGSDVIGALGLCGVAGALSASIVGRYVRRVGVRRFNFIGVALMLTAWALFYFAGSTYAGIIAGIIIIDIGMQCIQLSNQSSMFELCPGASSRVNTIFMTTYFLGGSLGTFLSGLFWSEWGWGGVSLAATLLIIVSLLITLCSRH